MCLRARAHSFFRFTFTRHILWCTRNWTLYIYITFIHSRDGWRAAAATSAYNIHRHFSPQFSCPNPDASDDDFYPFAKYTTTVFFFVVFAQVDSNPAAVSPNSKPLKKTSAHACPRVLFFVLEFTLSCTDNNHIIASPSMGIYIYIFILRK